MTPDQLQQFAADHPEAWPDGLTYASNRWWVGINGRDTHEAHALIESAVMDACKSWDIKVSGPSDDEDCWGVRINYQKSMMFGDTRLEALIEAYKAEVADGH